MASQALIKEFEDLLGKENVFSSEADRRVIPMIPRCAPVVPPCAASHHHRAARHLCEKTL